MNLDTLSNADLTGLIQSAVTELAGRLNAMPTASLPAVNKIDEPSADDKDFCMYIEGLLQAGKYIKADERQRVSDIADKHPAWVRKQGLPTERGTGPWRAAQEFLSAPRASVRR